MLEAKDTVMSENQIANIPTNNSGEPMVLVPDEDFKQEYNWVAQVQAEISFKAGYEEGRKDPAEGRLLWGAEGEQAL